MRANFLQTTRDVIARRAGYRCAFPDCKRLTVGPGVLEHQSEITGKAAHIYSAAQYGPRGQGVLSEDELRSASNGIWMCGEHSDLIDKNSGLRYAVETRKSWKALHESRIAYEHSGRLATFGFVRSLTVKQSALFYPGATIELAKATLLIGANGAGKTAICQWLSSLATLSPLLRWSKLATQPSLEFEIDFVAPIGRRLVAKVPDQTPVMTLDGVAIAANPLPIVVTYFEKTEGWSHYSDDLDLVRQTLLIDEGEVRALTESIDDKSLFLAGAEWHREQDDDREWRNRLYVRRAKGDPFRPFGGMSGSERSRVLLDFAIARCTLAAAFAPAILLLEVKGLGLDWSSLQPYMVLFSQSRTPFQTVITSWEFTPEMDELGWQVYQIIGDETPRRIEVNSPKSKACVTT